VFLVGIALLVGLFLWLVPTVSDQVTTLRHSAAHGVNQVKHWFITGPLHLSRHELQHDIDRLSRDARTHASGLALQGATIALEVAAGLLLTLVTTFFFVKDGERLARSAMQLFGRRRAAELPELGTLLWRTLTGYVRGTTINGLVNGWSSAWACISSAFRCRFRLPCSRSSARTSRSWARSFQVRSPP
jgi:predicted PurR-regulated permease PerM